LIIKRPMLILTFVFAGWLAMKFGVEINGSAVFDLRNVPIILATLMFRRAYYGVLIGLGIGACRYFVNGMSLNALTGSINITTLGCAAAGLIILYEQRKHWGYVRKAVISLVTINVLQVTGIALYGAVPTDLYLSQIMPYTLPLGLLSGALFLFIVHDFYKEKLRGEELSQMNQTLIMQTIELLDTKRELEERAKQLAQSSKYKSDFMYNMSHELRTPLNSIILLSQLIYENEEEYSENGEYANIIHSSSQELLQIINDILDLSKVEAGKMDMEWGPVSTQDITQLLYQQLQPLAAKKGLGFSVAMNDDVPELIVTDGLRLTQILRNLLSNAVKFTDKGNAGLNITLDSSGEWLLFSVKDTGIGIEAENQNLVFEAFQQEDGEVSRKYEGTGLGLSISRQLAKALGGTLSVASVKGQGSVFTLRLPLQPPSPDMETDWAEDQE
jgi:signal transduction histidine kinase